MPFPKPQAGPGVHPDRHRAHRIHPWVLAQSQVWVDAWGTEHELALMPGDYVQNALRFCRNRPDHLYSICAIAILPAAFERMLEGRVGEGQHLLAQIPDQELWSASIEPAVARDWLERTPLVDCFRRRLRALGLPELKQSGDDDANEIA